MTKACLLFLCIVFLCGCATSQQIYTPDGQEGHSIDCSGEFLSWSECYEKAGDICGRKGYDILDKIGEQSSTVAGGQHGFYGSSSMNRVMIIKCKP